MRGTPSRLSDIIVALVYIGLVGFVLDRIVAADRRTSSRAAPRPTEEDTPWTRLSASSITSTRASPAARRTPRCCSDITLAIEQGEFVSIIGHSGCGKSTLLNIVAGLTPVDHGRRAARGQGGERARARTAPWCSRTTRCCRGSPSTTTCGSRWTRCSAAPSRASRAPRLDHAQSRARADGARQGQAAGGNLRRHEAARRHRPRAGDGAEGAAARRAVRRARCADARASAGLGDGDPRRSSATRC